jgi:hypothetical protein
LPDDQLAVQAGRYRLASKVIDWVGTIALVVVVGLFADPIAHALAGHRTSVSLTVGISISLVGVAAVIPLRPCHRLAHGRLAGTSIQPIRPSSGGGMVTYGRSTRASFQSRPSPSLRYGVGYGLNLGRSECAVRPGSSERL